MTPEDKQHLRFIYNRMVEIHGENPNVDYMLKFNEIIGKEPINPSKSDRPFSTEQLVEMHDKHITWTEITGEHYKTVLEAIKTLKPYNTASSLHIHEERYMINNVRYSVLSALSDDPKDPNYNPTIQMEKP